MNELQRTLSRLNSDFSQDFNADDAAIKMVEDKNGNRQLIQSQSGNSTVQGIIAQSVGTLSITVTRNAANIATPLPFIVFGQNDFAAGYITTMQQLMQTVTAFNASTVFAITNVAGNVRFTYTATGPLVDIVTVSAGGNITYVAFLSSMAQNFFQYRLAQISISDENQNGLQFSQPVSFGELSALGKLANDQIILRSLVNSMTYRKDRVELIVPEQPVTPAYAYTSYIVPTANFSIGLDFFMSFRQNLNKTALK